MVSPRLALVWVRYFRLYLAYPGKLTGFSGNAELPPTANYMYLVIEEEAAGLLFFLVRVPN